MIEIKDVYEGCTGYPLRATKEACCWNIYAVASSLFARWSACGGATSSPLFLAKRVSPMRAYICCQDMQHASPYVSEYSTGTRL